MPWKVGEHPEHGCFTLVNPAGEHVFVYGPEGEDRRHAKWNAKLLNMSLAELEQIAQALNLMKKVYE